MQYRFSDTTLPSIVIIGGGFAGLALVKHLNNTPFRVTLIDRNNYHTFQPLLYQIASAGLTAENIAYPLRRKIGEYPNIIFRMAEVERIDTAQKMVITNTGNFPFDHLIIATGATTNFYGNTDLENKSLTLKSVPEALDMRSAILRQFEKAVVAATESERAFHMHFVIAGGGPTGVELAGALAEIKRNVIPHDYRELAAEQMEVDLIEGGARLLSGMTEKSSALAKKYLEKLGVRVRLNTLVTAFDGKILQLSDGTSMQTEHIIWTAGVKGATLSGIEPAAVTKGNRYLTDGFNRVQGYDFIYAIGDIAFMQTDPQYPNGHPGVAQVALQQAKNVADNFIRIHKQIPQQPFHYKNKGNMATIGRHRAVVDLPFISFGGYLAWYIWMFIHLMSLVGFRNRFMVFITWMWNYITFDRSLRLILERK